MTDTNTPTPASSEAAGGEVVDGEALDTTECSAYPNGGRCAHPRCLSRERNRLRGELASLRQQLAAAEQAKDDLVQWIGAVRDEMVSAGFPGGDRTVALANLRALIQQLAAARERNEALSDHIVRVEQAAMDALALLEGGENALSTAQIIGSLRSALSATTTTTPTQPQRGEGEDQC